MIAITIAIAMVSIAMVANFSWCWFKKTSMLPQDELHKITWKTDYCVISIGHDCTADTALKASVFGVFLVRIFPNSDWIRRDIYSVYIYPVQMRENNDQKNSKYGHFSPSVIQSVSSNNFVETATDDVFLGFFVVIDEKSFGYSRMNRCFFLSFLSSWSCDKNLFCNLMQLGQK